MYSERRVCVRESVRFSWNTRDTTEWNLFLPCKPLLSKEFIKQCIFHPYPQRHKPPCYNHKCHRATYIAQPNLTTHGKEDKSQVGWMPDHAVDACSTESMFRFPFCGYFMRKIMSSSQNSTFSDYFATEHHDKTEPGQ